MTKQARSMLRGMTKTEVMAIIHEAFLALEAEGLFERTGEVANGNIVWRATDPAMARSAPSDSQSKSPPMPAIPDGGHRQ